MSHENPASIVPGSMHVNRQGKKVFIESIPVAAPWRTSTIHRPIVGFVEGEDIPRAYRQNGQWFYGRYDITEKDSSDLISEYKEPVVYEAYLVVYADGCSMLRSTKGAAFKAISIMNVGEYKIIKLVGSEEVQHDV